MPGYMYACSGRCTGAGRLEQRANHDHLTGLMNRPNIEQRIRETVTRSAQGHVLLYMDLDRFKSVNDNAGHAAGDHLLKEIARVIRHNVRDRDLCARLGGDEFCVLLVDCSIDTAAQTAERIREQVHRYRLLWGGRVYSVAPASELPPVIRCRTGSRCCDWPMPPAMPPRTPVATACMSWDCTSGSPTPACCAACPQPNSRYCGFATIADSDCRNPAIQRR